MRCARAWSDTGGGSMDEDIAGCLIDRSSLGDAGAVALRRRAPRTSLDRILERTATCDPLREIFLHDGHRALKSDAVPHEGPSGGSPLGEGPMTLYPGQFTIRPGRLIGTGGLGTVDEVEVVATNQAHPIGTRLARKRLGPK